MNITHCSYLCGHQQTIHSPALFIKPWQVPSFSEDSYTELQEGLFPSPTVLQLIFKPACKLRQKKMKAIKRTTRNSFLPVQASTAPVLDVLRLLAPCSLPQGNLAGSQALTGPYINWIFVFLLFLSSIPLLEEEVWWGRVSSLCCLGLLQSPRCKLSSY